MRLTYQTPPYLRLLDSIRVLNLIVVFWILSQLSSFVHATDVELPLTPAYEGEHGQQGSSLERESAVLGMIIAAEREGEGEAHEGYRGEFAYLDPSLVGRAPEGVATLKLGEKMDMEANPGTTSNFVLERSGSQTKRESEGDSSQTENTTDGGQDVVPEKRQAGRTIYISVNTCRQPNPDTPIAIEDSPQLKVYISTSTENQKPGPKAQDNLVTDPIPLVAGAANYSLRTDSDVYIGVETLPLTRGWKGSYRFEVAASTDKFYHSYNGDDPFLFMIDTDSESSLFITHNITRDPGDKDAIDKWLQVPEIPFNMYVFPEQSWGARGLEHSLCGIREAFSANNTNKIKVDRTMTDRYGGKLPKAQFHVQNLQRSQNYTGFLLMDGNVSTEGLDLSNNLTVGKGGKVWKQFSWKTKAGMLVPLPHSSFPC
jgi:calcium channel MID1